MKTNARRTAALAATAVAATALPLALATPAMASQSVAGCTVTALDPEFRGTYNAQNIPYVYYPYEVTCIASPAGVTVEAVTTTWEQDLAGRAGDVDADGVNNADDEKIGTARVTRNFPAAGGTKTVTVKGVLSHTDTDVNDEMYHSVKIRVSSGAIVSPWSPLDLSQATRIWW